MEIMMRGDFVRTVATLALLVCLVTAPVANVTAVSATPTAASLSIDQLAASTPDAPTRAASQPVAVTAPEPSMRVDVPREATVGDSFEITVSAENGGTEAGEYSTISLSSPTLDTASRADEITGVSTTLPYDAFIEPGETIYTKDGESTQATDTLVEGSVGGGGTWGAGEHERLRVEVTPTEPGTYTFYVRTTLTSPSDTEVKETAPEYGDAVDQQGYEVRRITVEVTEESEANQAPTIDDASPEGEVSTAPGETSDEFSVRASDPDGDALSYTWIWWEDDEKLATFDDLGDDAEFHWDEPGDYRIQVVVSDGETTTSHSWSFVIEEETAEYELAVDATGGGAVEIDPPGVETTSFHEAYSDGEVVELSANPDDGYVFTGWEGDVSWSQEDEASIEVTMDEARSLTATFEREANHAPEISRVDPDGTVTTPPGEVSEEFSVHASDPDGDDLSYTWIWWDDGERIETFDDLGPDAEFHWDEPGDYRIEVVVSDGEATTSHSWPFVIEEQTTEYELAVDAATGGVVDVTPPGVRTTGFEQAYSEDTVVALTAVPDDGYTFTGWEGDVSYAQSDEASIEVTMDEARSLTATFEREDNHAPEITSAAPGGTVTTPPGELSEEFSVQASDSDGDALSYTWIWWEDGDKLATFDDLGDDAEFRWDQPGEYRIQVVVSDGETTTSQSWPFVIEEQSTDYELAVDTIGGGSVAITPPDVTTTDFREAYGEDTVVELSAIADDGYTFAGWEGDIAWTQEDERTIEVTMDEARSLTATFEREENEAPEITDADPDGEVTTAPDEPSDEFSVRASDPDGDDLTYTWIWWEDGERLETFEDLGDDAEFRWDQPGEYRIQVVVSDGEATTSHSWPFVIEAEDKAESLAAEMTEVAATGPHEVSVTGSLASLGAADQADVFVEYRPQDASEWDRTMTDTISDPGQIDWQLADLAAETTYEVRVVAATDTDRTTTEPVTVTTDAEEQTASSGRLVHTSLPKQYRTDQVVWAYVRIENPQSSTQSYRVTLADDHDVAFPRRNTREITVPGDAIGLVKIPVRLTGGGDSTTVDVRLTDADGEQLDTMGVRVSRVEGPTIREQVLAANERLMAAIDTQCWTLSEGCDSAVQREAAYMQYSLSFATSNPMLRLYLDQRRRNMLDPDERTARREGIVDGVSAAGVKTKEEVLGTVAAAKEFADSPVGFVVEVAGNTKRAVAVAAKHPELVTAAMERALEDKREQIRESSPYAVGTDEFEEYQTAWVQYYVSARIAIMVAAGKGTGKVATKVKKGAKLGKSSIVGRIDANEKLSGLYLRLYSDGYTMEQIQKFKTKADDFVVTSSLVMGELRYVLDSISYVRERTGFTPENIGDVAEALYLKRVAVMTDGKLVKSADDIPRDKPGTYLLHSVRVGPEGSQAGEFDVVQVEVTDVGGGTELRVTKVYEVTQGQSTAATSKYFGAADTAVKTKNSQLLTTLQDAKTDDYEIAKGLDASAFQHDEGVGSVIVGPARWSGDSTLVEQAQHVKMDGPGRVGYGASLPFTNAEFQTIDKIIDQSDLLDGYDATDRIVPRSRDHPTETAVTTERRSDLAIAGPMPRFSPREPSLFGSLNRTIANV